MRNWARNESRITVGGRTLKKISIGTTGSTLIHLFDANNAVVWRRTPVRISWNLTRKSSQVEGTRRDGSFIGGSPVAIPHQLAENVPCAQKVLDAELQMREELRRNARKMLAEGVDISDDRHDAPKRISVRNTHEGVSVRLEGEMDQQKCPGMEGFEKFKRDHGIPRSGNEIAKWQSLRSRAARKNQKRSVKRYSNQNWREYGSGVTFPIMKAAANGEDFAIVQKHGLVRIRRLKLDDDAYTRFARMRLLERISVHTPGLKEGLVVPARRRLIGSVIYIILSFALSCAAAHYRDGSWYDMVEGFFTIFLLLVISLPAILTLVREEPHLIHNCLRGKKVLLTDDQVQKFYGITEADYASLAIGFSNTGLMSRERACFLSGKYEGSDRLRPGSFKVSSRSLLNVGCYVGRSCWTCLWSREIYRADVLEEFEDGSGKEVFKSHLTKEVSRKAGWAAGMNKDTRIGGMEAV